MATPTVFITVPKYVAITPIPAPSSVASGATIVTPITTPSSSSSTTTNTSTLLAKIKPAPAPQQIHSPAISTVSDNDCCSDSSSTATPNPPRGKKRRLDHLTWEEKIQRKKLKNRVAAQTSRDRKKARMEEMESEIKELTARTQILVNKCESLQAINDSLLEKNQKLDMEVETLRQQLQDIQNKQQQQQQQQHSNLINTCAGWLTTQGLSVDTGAKQQQQCVEAPATVEKEHNRIIAVADNSSLPTLQDMLLPPEFSEIVEGTLDDAEFDAGKLEELAESLLADITADLEAGDRAGNASVAEITGGTERLPGSVVGTTAECLESGEHTGQNGSGLSRKTITTSTPLYVTSLQTAGELGLENKLENGAATSSITTQTLTAIQDATATNNNNNNNTNITPDTVYGTYDAKTNSITVVMDDVAVPVNEVVEEIYWDGAAAEDDDVDMIYTSASPSGIASPSQVFLNVTSCSDDEATTATHDDDGDDEDFNFDPIAKFLCPKRPLVSPLAKSPASSYHSATSDHGYESILGSPPSSSHYEPLSEDLPTEFSDWPPGFNELFPTLI
ncbi:PH domain-containing protein DDB_G0287875 [Musca vetustissima]|uniref:PH domain-containing protein DDB_G0287875 n=1 Tax=Musca vetustissima TaxID=27455 RepID=UPI002AB75DF6|nr:PH domain-containing protein DDB_G0287875 [Musca vetustissima]